MKIDDKPLSSYQCSEDNSAEEKREELIAPPHGAVATHPSTRHRPSDRKAGGANQDEDDRLLSIPEVCRIAGGKHRATIYRWAKQEAFSIVRYGPNSSGVWKSELMRFLRSCPPISPSTK